MFVNNWFKQYYQPFYKGHTNCYTSVANLSNMEFEVSVEYQDHLAKYRISPEQKNIFLAELIHYSGCTDYDPPPSGLIIMKGVRKWLGSIDSFKLVESLGEAIELK
jgi:hypothetical protein